MRKPLALSIMIALLTNSFPLVSIGNVFAEDAQATSTPININLSQEESTRFIINQQDKIVHDNETNLDWSLEIKKDDTDSLENAQNYCKTLGVDRRVPSIIEIKTIKRIRTPKQDQRYFEVFKNAINSSNTNSNTTFYTSTVSPRNGKVRFVGTVDLGNRGAMWNWTPSNRVICVKGNSNRILNQGKKDTPSELQYSFVDWTTKGENGIVKDEKTGLIWMSKGVDINNCTASQLWWGKYIWRMPNIAQLESLIDYSRDTSTTLAINTDFFDIEGSRVWKTEGIQYDSSYKAYDHPGSWPWGVSFRDGFAGGIDGNKTLCIADQAPTDIALSNNTLNDNSPIGTVVGTLTGKDPDDIPQDLTFALKDPNNADFTIENNTLKSKRAFDALTEPKVTVSIEVTDPWGAKSTKEIEVTIIDKKVPTGTITSNETSTTTNDVILTLTVSEPLASTPTGWTQDPNNPLIYTRTVENNGEITVNFTDKAGNPGSTTFNVTNIDRPDVIENPTQVPSSKYYAKVEFLPSTNGTLNETTVFYVLKNKEINLTAPTVNPNFGYTFNGRDTQVATNFTTDVTYTAQYTSSKVTLTHSHTSLTAGKDLPTSMPTIPNIETTYFTPTSPVNATLADVSDADLDGVWKFQSWSPATITVNTASDPTNFTAQWSFTPNQHNITYTFKAEDQNLTLPDAVNNLKPQNATAIMGDVINPSATFNPIEITDTTNPLKTGTWTFVARDQASKTVKKSDVEFIGTWKFTPKPATVRYEFQSDDTTALLESLNAYKPADENTTYGQTITPTSPKKTSEKTSEGTWNWKGWTETSKQVTANVMTFVGKWIFDPKPTGSITGQPTQWTKNTVTLTLTTNEDVLPPQGWTPVNNSKREFTKDIEGNSTISVVVTDLGGNDSVQITATVDKIDKVNPTLVTLATKGNVSLIKEAQVEIHFAGEDKLGTNPINNNSEIAKYQCQLNNGNWTDCTDWFIVTNLTEWTNTIKVKAIDNAGNESNEKEVSVVSDRTAPVITLENWDLTLIHNVDTYKPANASCKDNIDTSCTVTKSWPDVPAEIEKLKGQAIKDPVTFTEVFTATDKAGNEKQIRRTITLIPADFPKITLIGSPTVTQELGTPYSDAGATAEDKQDGDLTKNIVINNPVQDKLWTYTITYNVSDKSHNKASEVTRTITVVDTTKPKITPVSNQGFDEGKTITPIQITVTDHNPVVNIEVKGLPSGLSFDPTTKQITGKSSVIWIHTITITATDGSNNRQTSKFTLEIRDITPPVLESLKENFIRLRRGKPAEIVLTGTDNYKLGKIEIIGDLPAGMSISKTDFDGQKLAYLKITGTPTNIGTYHLTGTIVDKAGNKWNQIPFTIRVRATDPWSLNGGGGSSSSTDYCPNGDHSGNLYDGKCDKTIITITTGDNNPVEKKPVLTGDLEKKPEPEKDSKPELIDGKTLYPDTVLFNPTIINGKCYTRRPYVWIKDSTTIITDEEFKKAMSFLRSYEMTMFDSVDDYDPYRNLSREEAAKIFSNFAINVLCRKPDLNLKVNYSDTEDANPTLKPYITLAYQLGVMKGSGMGDGNFRPFDKITKAEVNAVLIRMILKSYLDESRSENKTWYDEYNKVATNLGIINQGAGAQPVSRNNVALMLFRAYKNQAFDWRDVDYFSYVLNSRDLFVK